MKPITTEFLIVVRCHEFPGHVLDTIEAVWHWTDAGATMVVAAVDNSQTLANMLNKHGVRTWVSEKRHGWGVGLFGMWWASLEYFGRSIKYQYAISIDYDTLFINRGLEDKTRTLCEGGKVGIIGGVRDRNERWVKAYSDNRAQIEKAWGFSTKGYQEGHTVLGAFMAMTPEFLGEAKKRGFLNNAILWNAAGYCRLPDDVLLSILCESCGYRLVSAEPWGRLYWRMPVDPQGMEKKGVIVFHPTKIRPELGKSGIETKVREYFRGKRGACADDTSEK